MSPARAFPDCHVPVDLEPRPRFGPPVRPDDARVHRSLRLAEPDDHAWIVGRRVAAVGPRTAPQRLAVGSDDGDARAEHVAAAVLADEPQADPVAPLSDPPNPIEQQSQRTARIADDEV